MNRSGIEMNRGLMLSCKQRVKCDIFHLARILTVPNAYDVTVGYAVSCAIRSEMQKTCAN